MVRGSASEFEKGRWRGAVRVRFGARRRPSSITLGFRPRDQLPGSRGRVRRMSIARPGGRGQSSRKAACYIHRLRIQSAKRDRPGAPLLGIAGAPDARFFPVVRGRRRGPVRRWVAATSTLSPRCSWSRRTNSPRSPCARARLPVSSGRGHFRARRGDCRWRIRGARIPRCKLQRSRVFPVAGAGEHQRRRPERSLELTGRPSEQLRAGSAFLADRPSRRSRATRPDSARSSWAALGGAAGRSAGRRAGQHAALPASPARWSGQSARLQSGG